MSEKIERRWRINSRAVLEVLYEGRWETAGTRWTYPDNGHNQRFAEAVADACGDIDALTSERDAAVRVAGELRAALEAAAEKFMRITWIALPRTMIMARAQDGWQEAQDALDSLTASTGGSSDEPQKGIRE